MTDNTATMNRCSYEELNVVMLVMAMKTTISVADGAAMLLLLLLQVSYLPPCQNETHTLSYHWSDDDD